MTAEQFLRVGELYHAARERASEARLDFPAQAGADEDELRRTVESRRQARGEAERSGRFLELQLEGEWA